jgi:hypothetical protein
MWVSEWRCACKVWMNTECTYIPKCGKIAERRADLGCSLPEVRFFGWNQQIPVPANWIQTNQTFWKNMGLIQRNELFRNLEKGTNGQALKNKSHLPNVYHSACFSSFLLLFSFYFIVFTFIYMCIYCLSHLPHSPPPTLFLGRTCFTLFSNFVEEKT